MAVLTLATYNTLMGLTDADTARDAQAEILIPMIQDAIEVYLGYKLDIDDRDEIYDGNDSIWLRLKSLPVNDIDVVTIAPPGSSFDSDDAVEHPGVEFVAQEKTGMMRFSNNSAFPCGIQNILVSYNSGYADGQIPPSITYAAALMLRSAILLATNDVTMSKLTLDQYQETFGSFLEINDHQNAFAAKILDRFKPVRFI